MLRLISSRQCHHLYIDPFEFAIPSSFLLFASVLIPSSLLSSSSMCSCTAASDNRANWPELAADGGYAHPLVCDWVPPDAKAPILHALGVLIKKTCT
jgi:hypothetical protein